MNKTITDMKNDSVHVIAEIGSNHNQDLNTAFSLIDEASKAGVDAVKFQLFQGKRHYSKYTPMFTGIDEHPVHLLEKIELPRDWIGKIKKHAEKKGVQFICSVTSSDDVDLLKQHNVQVIKIASFEIVDLPLIQYAAKNCESILISTGMATLSEIEDAYQICKKEKTPEIVFFQCASAYPAKPEIMNIKAITTLKHAFPDTIIGLSDHTTSTVVSPAAVAIGAKVIEKHFTLDKKMAGPDHHFALNPVELTQFVNNIRDTEKALGNGQKLAPSDDEMEFYFKARRSIHARVDIQKGTKIKEEHLIIKRPGFGIKPKHFGIVKNRTATADIKADEWITWEKI